MKLDPMVLLAGPILKGHEFRGDVHQRGERDAVRRRVDRVRGVQGLPLLLDGRPGVHGALLLAGKQARTLLGRFEEAGNLLVP